MLETEADIQKSRIYFKDISLNDNGLSPGIRKIIKRAPVTDQMDYVGSLLSFVSPTLKVKILTPEQQEKVSSDLCKAGVSAVEVFAEDNQEVYAFTPGQSMDVFMVEHGLKRPDLINSLVCLHQRYVEQAHDDGISIYDRWPGNAIVTGSNLANLRLIDFDVGYDSTDGDTEEVFSTFQCVSWVMEAKLQQDLATRLIHAVYQRFDGQALDAWLVKNKDILLGRE